MQFPNLRMSFSLPGQHFEEALARHGVGNCGVYHFARWVASGQRGVKDHHHIANQILQTSHIHISIPYISNMLYTYITCILFAILAMLYSTATTQSTTESNTQSNTQPNTASSANNADLDAFLQRSILQETTQECIQIQQYHEDQQRLQQKVQREHIRDQAREKAREALLRERLIYLATSMAESDAVFRERRERPLNCLCHQLSCLRITRHVRWGTIEYFEPAEEYPESESSTEADE